MWNTSKRYQTESSLLGITHPPPRTIHLEQWGLDFDQNLSPIGQPGISVSYGNTHFNLPDDPRAVNPFTDKGRGNLALDALPSQLGWNYQSFGVWNDADSPYPWITLSSVGALTPATAMPTTGAATFTGKLAGLYVSPTGQGAIAAANVAVYADFSNRSLSFSSDGTILTRDLTRAAAAANLNLSGTLTYSPGSNTFAGTLVNAGGTMSGLSKGQFYGPTAQDLGGVFTVKSQTSVETLAGAYGAKR